MDVSIDRYAPDDRAAVLALAVRLSTGAAPWRDPDDVTRAVTGWVREALDAPETNDLWVAHDGPDVVGFVHVGTRTHWTGEVDAYVGELAVASSHAGHGIGALLMRRAEEWARAEGHTRLTLEVGADNTDARGFYAQIGYVTEEVVLTRDLTWHDRVMDEQERIEPDTKDWTVVITQGCDECGFDAGLDVTTTGERLRQSIVRWQAVLERSDVTERPSPTTWSALEYAAHVRDVCDLFRERLHLMLTDDDARFANWDQDATAVERRYHEQDPATVAQEYAIAALALAAAFDQVHGEQWERRGLRSNGSEFTVATFAVYLLHDIEHHLVDVSG